MENMDRKMFLTAAALTALTLSGTKCAEEKDKLFGPDTTGQDTVADATAPDVIEQDAEEENGADATTLDENSERDENKLDTQDENKLDTKDTCVEETATAKSFNVVIENGGPYGNFVSGNAEDIVINHQDAMIVSEGCSDINSADPDCTFGVNFDNTDTGKTFLMAFVALAGEKVDAETLRTLSGNGAAGGGFEVHEYPINGSFRSEGTSPDLKNVLETFANQITQNIEGGNLGMPGIGNGTTYSVGPSNGTQGKPQFESQELTGDTLFVIVVPVDAKMNQCVAVRASTNDQILAKLCGLTYKPEEEEV